MSISLNNKIRTRGYLAADEFERLANGIFSHDRYSEAKLYRIAAGIIRLLADALVTEEGALVTEEGEMPNACHGHGKFKVIDGGKE